ncbi:MAG: HAMP domain-containing protein [Gammaproteobacteria bacterium]|nr:HAMP domain-containing protein [Gammaproteobacteria bacterium]
MMIRSPGLAGRLAIVTALLVTLAVGVVSLSGVRALRRLADAEGLARTELAVAAARESLRRSTENLLTAARVLAERPTLDQLLSDADIEALDPYLVRYCEGALLDGCMLLAGGRRLAATGQNIEWALLAEAAERQGERFLVTGASPGVLLAGATTQVETHPGVTAMAVRRMDERFAQELSDRSGLEVRIVDYASFGPGEGPFAVINTDALSSGEPAAARIRAENVYAASLPVIAAGGETVALLQALLPAAQVMDPVDTMTRRMFFVAVLIAALAIGAGIAVGRQWISGVYRLAEAARRIGAGDLAAAIPAEGGRELGVLAGTMEEMRRDLIGLTSELRRREAEAQAVLGGIVEGVYAVDQARRIRFLNPQAERLLGISSSDALGRFCGDVLQPKPDDHGRRPCEKSCPIIQARRTGRAEAMERIEPVPGRHRRVVIASATPADGMQVQVLRDETELEAVRRTRDTILANISHEFRTPLAAQLASIELLKDGIGESTPAEQRQLLTTLERGAQRLTWLIDNLLESVRIEAGQLGIRRQRVRLAEVIAAARELIGPLIEQRGQVLDIEAGVALLPLIQGDVQRLTQVVVNLLANASKYAPEGSVIRIGADGTAGAVAFWVDDEGPGPTEPDSALLFEQFRRSAGEEPDESGLGLGLYIVRSIVERHGGTVSLSRTSEGRTRVKVELSAPPESSAERLAQAVGSTSRSGSAEDRLR